MEPIIETSSSSQRVFLSEKPTDINALEVIDTEAKAYLLGFLTNLIKLSSHKLTITIQNARKNTVLCQQISDVFGKDVVYCTGFIIGHMDLIISNPKIIQDASEKLGLSDNNTEILFPKLESDSLKWAFVRGCFDDGPSIPSIKYLRQEKPDMSRVFIQNSSIGFLKAIGDFCGISYEINGDMINWKGSNTLDFLTQTYKDATIFVSCKRKKFYQMACAVYGFSKSPSRLPIIKIACTLPEAVVPSKVRASDSGYDLTIIKKVKAIGTKTTLYDTGLVIEMEQGWYADIVPRSSIIKTGYILSNSVGIIDRPYTGNLMIALTKIDDSLPDLELPFRIAQLIPRPMIHFDIQVVGVQDITKTERQEKGFGSSDTQETVKKQKLESNSN